MAAAGGPISDTVDRYDRHVILCWKGRESWPPSFELPEVDLLPRKLFSASNDRKDAMKKKTILTVCEGGNDDLYFADGDVFIFPDMIRYSALKETYDLDGFVEDVLVKGIPWGDYLKEPIMEAAFVFICAHKSNDPSSGDAGEAVYKHMNKLIMWNDLRDIVLVRACSSIQGHQDYPASLIIFSRDIEPEVDGHWYGLVTPSSLSEVLQSHLGRGTIYEQLWRSNMGPKWEHNPNWLPFKRGDRREDIGSDDPGKLHPWCNWQTSEKPRERERSEHDMGEWFLFFGGIALGAIIIYVAGFPKTIMRKTSL